MPVAEFTLRHPSAELQARYRAEGLWTDDTFPQVTRAALERAAAAPVRVRSLVRPFTGTVGDLADQGDRLASYLSGRGIGTGDVVAFQLPNWAEAASCFYGLLQLGAVLVPIVHIYGRHELGHILRESRARVLITADRFGRQDFSENLEALEGQLGCLEHVIVVSTTGTVPTLGIPTTTWERVMKESRPARPVAPVDPDLPAVIGYTSGTTAAPKGVIHTHRTLLGELRQNAVFRSQEKAPAPRVTPAGSLSAAPVSHITGLLGVLGPIQYGGGLQLMDQWDPAVVLRAMREETLSSGGGATFFLTSLIEHPDFDPAVHVPLMSRLGLGGAPIPAAVARQANELGILLMRAYGSTEHPSTTMSLFSDPEDKRVYTDGRAMPGIEIRIVDDDGRDLPPGTPGEILSRGPDLFVGYADPALTATTLDSDGWYSTGDIGILDPEGYLTITDRKKDVIIRGGENVSAAEVEEVMLKMPAVAEVAVVAAPDPRYGEHGCAFVRLQPGAGAFELADLRLHLAAAGLARQKWPEELCFVDDLPRTASGKVQKHVLRARLRGQDG